MKRFRPQSVRTRMTLWYVAVLAGVLLIYIGSASALLFFHLRGQLDHLAIEDLESVEGLLSFRPDGKLTLRNDYHDHPDTPQMQERLMEVSATDGTVLYRSEVLGNRTLGGAPGPGEGTSSYSQRSIRLSDGAHVRVASKRHAIEGHPTTCRHALMWKIQTMSLVCWPARSTKLWGGLSTHFSNCGDSPRMLPMSFGRPSWRFGAWVRQGCRSKPIARIIVRLSAACSRNRRGSAIWWIAS